MCACGVFGKLTQPGPSLGTGPRSVQPVWQGSLGGLWPRGMPVSVRVAGPLHTPSLSLGLCRARATERASGDGKGAAKKGTFRNPSLLSDQLCGIMHSSWIFPRDNEWIFRGYRALMDLGTHSGPCSGLDGPSGSCPSSGIRAGSEDSLDRRRVDPGSWRDSSSEAWRSRNRV